MKKAQLSIVKFLLNNQQIQKVAEEAASALVKAQKEETIRRFERLGVEEIVAERSG